MLYHLKLRFRFCSMAFSFQYPGTLIRRKVINGSVVSRLVARMKAPRIPEARKYGNETGDHNPKG